VRHVEHRFASSRRLNDPDKRDEMPAHGVYLQSATSRPDSADMDFTAHRMSPPVLRYSTPAIVLHWLLAVAIVCSFCLGLYMTGLPFSPARLKLYNYHKWAGVTILGLSAARLLWRLARRPPADVPMPAWQRIAAHATHGLLYVLFFAVPLVGWAYSSAAGFSIVWFGVLPLPDFVPVDKALAALLKPWHGRLAITLMCVVGLHVLGALKHQFIDRDRLIARMWPRPRAASHEI
jgi:cytochrome b561